MLFPWLNIPKAKLLVWMSMSTKKSAFYFLRLQNTKNSMKSTLSQCKYICWGFFLRMAYNLVTRYWVCLLKALLTGVTDKASDPRRCKLVDQCLATGSSCLRWACPVSRSRWGSCRRASRRRAARWRRRRLCGGRGVWAAAFQTWLAGSGTGCGSTPPTRTATSPAAARSRGVTSVRWRLKQRGIKIEFWWRMLW